MNVVRGVTEWIQRIKVVGVALDWAEALAGAVDDPESRPAGVAEPHYAVSSQVTVSREHGLYVYHVAGESRAASAPQSSSRA